MLKTPIAMSWSRQSVVFRHIKVHNRPRAMIALIKGFRIRSVAKIFGVSVRPVQQWGGRFNRQSIEDLRERPHPGRPPKIDTETAEQYRDLIKHPDKAGQTHWTIERLDKAFIRAMRRHTENSNTCSVAIKN